MAFEEWKMRTSENPHEPVQLARFGHETGLRQLLPGVFHCWLAAAAAGFNFVLPNVPVPAVGGDRRAARIFVGIEVIDRPA